MSSKYVTITGADLDYFKSIVSQGLSGEFGELTELRLVFNDEAGFMIGANGYSSEYIGTVENSEAPYQENTTAETSSEPEVLGDILKRMFPKGETVVTITNML